jgi:hypothetical protein
MPRVCTICAHPKRADIDKALLSGQAYRTIAGRWSVSKSALLRHKDAGHVSAAIARRQEGKKLLESKSLTEKVTLLENRVNVLYDDALVLLQQAKRDGDSKTGHELLAQHHLGFLAVPFACRFVSNPAFMVPVAHPTTH